MSQLVVADWAWWDGINHLDELLANGITGAIRYAAYPGHSGKGMYRDEFQRFLDANFPVAWIMETFAQAASRGYGQGNKEAQMAFEWADSIGWPRDRPGYFCGEDPNQIPHSSYPAVADYFRAVHDVDPGRPLPGCYGSGDLCQYLWDLELISMRWHVSTWAGGNRELSNITQEANGIPGYSVFGGKIDLNSVHSEDWGQVPGPISLPKDDEMFSASPSYPCVHITSLRNHKVVDIAGDIAEGAPWDTYGADGLVDQRIRLIAQPPLDEVCLVSRADDLALDCASDGTNRIHAVKYDLGNANQRWFIDWHNLGVVTIRHAHRDDQVLTVDDTDGPSGLHLSTLQHDASGNIAREQLFLFTDTI